MPEQISLEALAGLPSLHHPRVSPDGGTGHGSTDIDHRERVFELLAAFLDERFPA